MNYIENAEPTLRTIRKWLDCVGAMCVQLAFHIVYVAWDFVSVISCIWFFLALIDSSDFTG